MEYKFIRSLLTTIISLLVCSSMRAHAQSVSFDVPLDGYSIEESTGSIQVCVIVSGAVSTAFTLTLTTQPITALEFVDYTPIDESFTFMRTSGTTDCATISIVQDGLLESSEFFLVSVTSNDASIVLPPPQLITILDSNNVVLEFQNSTFTTDEGQAATVCVVIQAGVIERPVAFTVTPSDGTAKGSSDDFAPISIARTFTTNSDSPLCFSMTVNEDTVVESDETFTITLSSPDSPSDREGTVIIRDNDGVSIALSSLTLSASEGNSGTTAVPLCVQLQDFMTGLERDVPLSLSTSAGTADSSDFLTLSNEQFTVPFTAPLNQDVCFDLTINGDEIREGNETFTVTLLVGNSNDIIVGSNTVTVTILDDNDVIADCMTLESPQNGAVQFNSTLQGSTATYTCITGYSLDGAGLRTCLSTGLWSDSDPTCELEDCGTLEAPQNGAVTYTATTYQSVATYGCNTGYNRVGAGSRTCQSDGSWSGEEPICQIADCGELSDPENGVVTYASTVYLSQARYSCNEGYELSQTGSILRICRANGQWTSFPPQCNPVDCGPLANPNNGAVSLSGTTFMNIATYSCSAGHSLVNGDEIRECQSDETWSGTQPLCQVDCGSLAVPSSGMITYSSGTLVGSTATYSCDLGYVFDGANQQRTCELNGQWSGSEPTGCQPRDCGDPGVPDNGHLALSSGTTVGSVASYTCDNGHRLTGESTRQCGTDGQWTNSVPTCTIVDCGTLIDPTNGVVHLSGTVFGSQANYSCIDGYSLVGATTRSCLESEEWSDSAPSCQIVDCGVPNHPGDGDVTFSLTVFNALAFYTCDNGYNLFPSESVRTCEANGLWSGDDRICQPVDCGNLPSPQNGEVHLQQTTLGSVATYTCNLGYDLVGVGSATCLPSGVWSDGTPECIAVDCGSLNSPTNGDVSLSGTTFESTAQYTCDTGYLLMGVEMRQCQANRTWSDEGPTCEAVNCGDLTAPDNGIVDLNNGTRLSSIAKYHCNTGYNLQGDAERTCTEEGVWSGNSPVCEIVQCAEVLTSPENGNVMITGDTYLSEAHYECNEGYTAIGVTIRVCEDDGLWSGVEPHCEVNMCPVLEDPENGMIRFMEVGFEAGLLATYECNEGYTISSFIDSTRVCELSGQWTGEAPTCIINDCGEDPPTPVNGRVLTSGTTFGSRALFVCDAGYVLSPSSDYDRICLANETWSGVDPTCEPIDCGILGNPLNGEVITNGTTLGSTAYYVCSEGYEIAGDVDRLCQMNGSWSNSEPSCTDIDECIGDHGCDQICINDEGTFHCECEIGYQSVDTFTCADVDECEDSNGGCDQLCNNTFGSFLCGCSDGYLLTTDDINCDDIDECFSGLDGCHENATCYNTNGSFHCMCDEGYDGDGFLCTDVDECMTEAHTCDSNALCNNTDGGFECDCLIGYEGDGFTCENINECETQPSECHEDAECIDTDGSFMCTCRSGFTGDGFLCKRQCSRMFQLLLTGVNNCQQWRLESTEEKLMEIEQSILEGILQTCPSCDSQLNHIQDGEFSCPNGADAGDVLYRATLFSNEPESCEELLTAVTNWIQSSQVSSTFQSSSLSLQVVQTCAVEIDSFQSELDCQPVPTTEVGEVKTSASSSDSLVVVGGAVAGVAVGIVVLALLVIIIAVVVIVKKKKQKRFTLHTHFIDPSQQYDSLRHSSTPLHNQESLNRRAHLNDYEENNVLETSTFNPEGNVLPTLGQSFSDRKRHQIQSPYAEIGEVTTANGKPHQDEFYEKVYEDGYHFDVEEIYDHTQTLSTDDDLEDTSTESSFTDNPLYEKVEIDFHDDNN